MGEISKFVPSSLFSILFVLALSFLIGLEREERHRKEDYSFGGVRTFPLVGLCGYLLARLSQANGIAIAMGFIGIASLLWLSYRKKLELSSNAGMTSEVSALFTYLLGAFIYQGAFWEATALAVAALLLLELKTSLELLARRIPEVEIQTFTRFLLISGVILPLLPNQSMTEFGLNPFRIWLVVVAISGLSYLAYVLEQLFGATQSALMSAALGGLYSSTVTTVALAKRSADEKSPRLLSGAILVASGLMYFRLIILLYIFNVDLSARLIPPFLALGTVGTLGGWIWSKTGKEAEKVRIRGIVNRNPLELQAAVFFALLFVVMAILTKLVVEHAGTSGLYGLSFLTGLTDIDPFVMSLSQSAGRSVGASTPLFLAAKGIVIASASNNIMKGIYAFLSGSDELRWQAMYLLLGIAAATFFVLPLMPSI